MRRTGVNSTHHDLGRFDARTPGSWLRVIVAVALVAGTSSAPWIMVEIHVLEHALTSQGWPYVFSYWLTAIAAGALFVHDVVPLLAWRSRNWLVVGPTLALGAWALASSWWTESPERTPFEALLMAVLLVAAMWFGFGLDHRTKVWVLYGTLQGLVLGSYLVATKRPLWGVDPYGNWQGMFANRNTLGPTATLAVVFSVAAAACLRRWPLRALVVIPVVLDLYVAKRAGSVTAWIALVAATATALGAAGLAFARSRGVRRNRLVVGTAGVLLLVVAATPVMLHLLGELGRGTTFSGRRVVWDFIFDEIEARPIGGFGFASFWDHPDFFAVFNAETGGRWDSGHSSFMDMLLWCGFVGFILIIAVVVTRFVAVAGDLLDGGVGAPIVAAASLAFLVIENLTESMVGYHAVFWVLLIAVVGSDRGLRRRPEPAVPDAEHADAGAA